MEESEDLFVEVDNTNQPENGGEFESEDKSLEPQETPSKTSDPIKETKPVKHLKLPLARIKHIMKLDPEINIVQHDAVILVTKATEMFIESLVKECYRQLTISKRKSVMKRDVDVAIETVPQFCFLDGALE